MSALLKLAARPRRIAIVLGILALLALAAAGIPIGTDAGVAPKVTVNSTANTDDGDCEGFPNEGTGNCTLREAINAVNDGLADVINFHPPVFSKANPGVIDLDSGLGELPPIDREVTIDAKDRGVILDGNSYPDGVIDYGLKVIASHNGFDFTLIGGKNFVIRQIDGDGIQLDGDDPGFPSSFADVDINGVVIHDVTSDGIWIGDATNLMNISITNSAISADSDGIHVEAQGASLGNNRVTVNGNSISGGEDGVDIRFNGDLSSAITATVSGNDAISGVLDGIKLDYCDLGACDAANSTIDFSVSNNGEIAAGDRGVHINIDAAGGASSDLQADVSIAGTMGPISGGSGGGVAVAIDICCGQGHSTSTVAVEGNSDIIGGSIGVSAHNEVCCGDDNTTTVTVSGNRDISGTDAGVFVFTRAGVFATDGDRNTSSVTVSSNRDITGAYDGISINGAAGGDTFGSDNYSIVTVVANDDITAQLGDGVDIDSETCCDDFNNSTVTVSDNTTITGNSGNAVDIRGEACCDDYNSSAAVLTGNGDTTASSDAIHIGAFVCCGIQNTNTIEISQSTGVVTGLGGDGIEIVTDPISTAVTTVTITGNAMSSSGQNGIRICCGDWTGSAIANNMLNGNGASGILVDSASGVTIGPGNVISNNGGGTGVQIVRDTATALFPGATVRSNANAITQNSIYDNVGLGIDLDGDGVGCVPFAGGPISPNDCVPFPVLLTQAGDKLVGVACALCAIEVFLADDAPPDQAGHGEGREFLVSGQTDDVGDFSIGLPCGMGAGYLTATATDLLGNTSEFSENLPTLGTSVCATATPPVVTNTPTETAAPTPTATPTATPTKQPDPGDTDGDGCPDVAENGPDERQGGRRDYLNEWDYFNPTGDGQNRIDDVFEVIGKYRNDDPPNTDYVDRTLLGPNPWDLGPPNGQIRIDDVINIIAQYRHDCA